MSGPDARAGRRRAAQSGLTLLELLVTLAIAAAAAGVLAQAVWQTYRIESLLADDRLRGQTVLLRTEWVRQALAGLQPGEASGRGSLRGEARELSGVTTNPIATEAAGFGALRLRLQFNAETGETELAAEMPGAERSVQVLLRWPGDSGRFLYLGAKWTVETRWPPPLGEQPPLPAAVVVETGLAGFQTLVAVPLAAERTQRTRREIEQR